MYRDTRLLPSRKAADILGVHPNTLRNWEDRNDIAVVKTPAGQRLYDVQRFLSERQRHDEITTHGHDRIDIIYCRVSSRGQLADLERQTNFLRTKYPRHRLVTDVASGLNNKRKGLQTLLELAMSRNIGELVVTNRDRLSRFGFDIIERIVALSGGRVVVLNRIGSTPQSELVEDITSILHVFSCRIYGRRRHASSGTKESQTQKEKREDLCFDGLRGDDRPEEQILLPTASGGARDRVGEEMHSDLHPRQEEKPDLWSERYRRILLQEARTATGLRYGDTKPDEKSAEMSTDQNTTDPPAKDEDKALVRSGQEVL